MQLTGDAAGVPYLAVPPVGGSPGAPVVLAYHLLDAPRTEAAFAAAVPLKGLAAWRVYLGLPLTGARQPAGGIDKLLMEDPVGHVYRHVGLGALAEFPAAFQALRRRLRLDPSAPVGVMGGSMGGAVAQLVAADGGVPVKAAVLINPVVRLRATIDALTAMHGVRYEWTAENAAIADRIDFVRRASDLRGTTVRFITGADDMPDAIVRPVEAAVVALREAGVTVDHQVVPGLAHALADEPGVDAAPQTAAAKVVDRLAAEWFQLSL